MEKRSKDALITLIIGLALNICLGVTKLVVGLLSDSAAVLSDSFNNLSDAAVSVVTIIAVWLSSRAADHDHPFGHGRYEYIATFVLGAVIVAVGAEALTGGIRRAINPIEVRLDTPVWATLGISVGVKAFMGVFYTVRGRSTGSDAIKAAAVDSFSDSVVTSVVLICALIERFAGVPIDAYVSMAVSLFILVFAVRILKGTINRLLGERPDQELMSALEQKIKATEGSLSFHDLIINDYGASKKIAEVDLVFPAEMTFLEVHGICDRLERGVYDELGVSLSVHADPFVTDDARLDLIRRRIEEILRPFGASAHDITINDDEKCVELDICLPKGSEPRKEITGLVEAETRAELGYALRADFDYI